MMIATIMLRTRHEASTMKEMKKGTATYGLPQLPSSSEQPPVSCVTIASCISPFHDSPVVARNMVRKATPKLQKLASALR